MEVRLELGDVGVSTVNLIFEGASLIDIVDSFVWGMGVEVLMGIVALVEWRRSGNF